MSFAHSSRQWSHGRGEVFAGLYGCQIRLAQEYHHGEPHVFASHPKISVKISEYLIKSPLRKKMVAKSWKHACAKVMLFFPRHGKGT